MTYWGFWFDALASVAGVVAFFLAIKAYKIGVRAYEVSAESYRIAQEQGRKSLEIELIRDIGTGTSVLIEQAKAKADEEFTLQLPHETFTRLLMFSPEEFPLWNFLTKKRSFGEMEAFLLNHELAADDLAAKKRHDDYGRRHLASCLFFVLHWELYEALARRTDQHFGSI